MPMITIKQRYEQDCFLCCIAMAAGLSYDDAIEKWGGDFVEWVGQVGLHGQKNIDRAFDAIPFARNWDYRVVYPVIPGNGQEWPQDNWRQWIWGRRACIQVKSKNYENRHHIVYWDGDNLHDPSPKKTFAWGEVQPVWVWVFNELVIPALTKDKS
jgi:hypothetical protein